MRISHTCPSFVQKADAAVLSTSNVGAEVPESTVIHVAISNCIVPIDVAIVHAGCLRAPPCRALHGGPHVRTEGTRLVYRTGKFYPPSRLLVLCFSFQAVRPDRPNPSFPEKDADSGPSPGADVGPAKPPSRVPAPCMSAVDARAHERSLSRCDPPGRMPRTCGQSLLAVVGSGQGQPGVHWFGWIVSTSCPCDCAGSRAVQSPAECDRCTV